MSWNDEQSEYSNGADGTCQECGNETDEPWHALCSDCYSEQQGWRRSEPPDAHELALQSQYRHGYREGFRQGVERGRRQIKTEETP